LLNGTFGLPAAGCDADDLPDDHDWRHGA